MRHLRIANAVHLDRVFRAQSVLLDIRLVFRFRDGDVVVVVPVKVLDLNLIKRIGIGFAPGLYRVLRARNDEIVIGQVVGGLIVGNVHRAVPRMAAVPVGDDFQAALRKYRRAVGLLQQFGNIPLRLPCSV